jgi:hypothetical protein
MVGNYKDMPTNKPATAPKLAAKPEEVKVAYKIGETRDAPITATNGAARILQRILAKPPSSGR